MYTSGSIMSLNPDFMYYASFMCMCRMLEISYHQELVQEGYNSYSQHQMLVDVISRL